MQHLGRYCPQTLACFVKNKEKSVLYPNSIYQPDMRRPALGVGRG